jgi:hypothetical protein
MRGDAADVLRKYPAVFPGYFQGPGKIGFAGSGILETLGDAPGNIAVTCYE